LVRGTRHVSVLAGGVPKPHENRGPLPPMPPGPPVIFSARLLLVA